MTKINFTRYVCDVLLCHEEANVDFRNGEDSAPLAWGFISINKVRGHSNLGMWLCPDHFATIDGWLYTSHRGYLSDAPEGDE